MQRVIKIGSSSVLTPTGDICPQALHRIGRGVQSLCQAGDQVILVVSGAVGLGRHLDPVSQSPRQALAALGQIQLMAAYQSALAPLCVGQFLVESAHFSSLMRALVLQEALYQCWNAGIIPLVNENDSLNIGISRIGDNDTLGALIATLIRADQLVLLSDIDGLYTDNPRKNNLAQRIPYIPWVGPHHLSRYDDSPGPLGSGGITTKLRAAQIAQNGGIETLLMNSHDPNLWTALAASDFRQATHFAAKEGAFHD